MNQLKEKLGNEVIAFSVLESLIFDEEIKSDKYIQLCEAKTLEIIEEIVLDI